MIVRNSLLKCQRSPSTEDVQEDIEVSPYAAIDDGTDAYHSQTLLTLTGGIPEQIIATHTKDKTEIKIDSDRDDGSDDAPLPIPAVQTVKRAFKLLFQIAEFADYQGCEELPSAMTKVYLLKKRSNAKEWQSPVFRVPLHMYPMFDMFC